MKRLIWGLLVAVMMVAAAGCASEKGDAAVEKMFDGGWEYELHEVEDGVKITVTAQEEYSFDDHTFTAKLRCRAGYPVNAWMFTMEYSGSWAANSDMLINYVNENSISFRYNTSLFDDADGAELEREMLGELERNGWKEMFEIVSMSHDRINLKDGEGDIYEYRRTAEGRSSQVAQETEVVEEPADYSIASKEVTKLPAEIFRCGHLSEITLRPQAGNDYDAANLFDGRPSTAWAIDWTVADSINCVSNGHLPPDVGIRPNGIVSYITIRNGYCKSDESFLNNSRVKSITVMGCMDNERQADELYSGPVEDTSIEQRIDLGSNGKRYDWLNIIIDEVYPGRKWADVCISEIEFFGTPS